MHIAQAIHDPDPNEPGFVHAVALAARTGAALTTVHVREPGEEFFELPDARTLLQRWGIPEDRIAHTRVQRASGESVEDTLLEVLAELSPDLLVASTHARGGIARLLVGSVAESVARNLRTPVLLVPIDSAPLAQASTGTIRLARMLLPAGTSADAERAVAAAVSFAHVAGEESGQLVLLHVEDGRPAPQITPPRGFRVVIERAHGAVDDAVVAAAERTHADLIVMLTAGHDGVGDVLLASHTERVLHRCRRPLLWVPLNR